jgi:hypothetical protein
MIHQISNVKTKTAPLPKINRGLIQARHIQAHLKERIADGVLPNHGYILNPMGAAPYLVRVTRWIE